MHVECVAKNQIMHDTFMAIFFLITLRMIFLLNTYNIRLDFSLRNESNDMNTYFFFVKKRISYKHSTFRDRFVGISAENTDGFSLKLFSNLSHGYCSSIRRLKSTLRQPIVQTT